MMMTDDVDGDDGGDGDDDDNSSFIQNFCLEVKNRNIGVLQYPLL